MKYFTKFITALILSITMFFCFGAKSSSEISNSENLSNNLVNTNDNLSAIALANNLKLDVIENAKVYEDTRVLYEGLTREQAIIKVNKMLKSTLSGKGELFVNYSVQRGVNPVMAVAITLQETGCAHGNCSELVKQCNNVGGMKGAPGCWGGSYHAFNTIDEGIRAFIDNLANNYVRYGLKTPEQINPKYAEDTLWAPRVRAYMEKIKAA